MSINYYAITQVTDEDKVKMKVAIDKVEFGVLNSLMPKTIHIGKLNGNMKFLFDTNDKHYYELNRKSINLFLQKCTIQNEYGEKYDLVQFWLIVERAQQNPFTEIAYGFTSDGLNFFYRPDFS
jgi:hypothetical protein